MRDRLARHTLAHDASRFLLLPEAVTAPADEAEVVALLRQAATGKSYRLGLELLEAVTR